MQGAQPFPTRFHWLLIAGVVGLLVVMVAFAASGAFSASPMAPLRGGQTAPVIDASPTAAPTSSPSAGDHGQHVGDGGGGGEGGDSGG